MLTELRLGNFKAFGDAQRIPIKPLTLIFGANSSGKSSIIHGLILLHHAMETGDIDAHRTRIGGDSVDLGGFRRYVYNRDISRRVELSIGLSTGATIFSETPFAQIRVVSTVGIPQWGTRAIRHDGRPQLLSLAITADDEVALELSIREDGQLYVDHFDEGMFNYADSLFLPDLSTRRSARSRPKSGLLAIGLGTGGVAQSLFPTELIGPETENEDDQGPATADLEQVLGGVLRGIVLDVEDELRDLRYLGPLRSYPPRSIALAPHLDPSWESAPANTWTVLRTNDQVRGKVNRWLNDEKRLQTRYEIVLRRWVNLDRVSTGFLTDFTEYIKWSFENLSHVRKGESFRHFLARVYQDPELYAVHVREAVEFNDLPILDELVLIDRRSNTPVSHRDVGIGISQVLPVLVEAYAAENQIIAIEQPEIHLHPALQAELGDVFITSALGDQHNTFILETHSEHLILRIMRRMRETADGTLPEGLPPVRPEEVAILFVEPVGSQSGVRVLELDEEGELLDPWPGGFFEEGFRERFS